MGGLPLFAYAKRIADNARSAGDIEFAPIVLDEARREH
jgi:hypothetical protein